MWRLAWIERQESIDLWSYDQWTGAPIKSVTSNCGGEDDSSACRTHKTENHGKGREEGRKHSLTTGTRGPYSRPVFASSGTRAEALLTRNWPPLAGYTKPAFSTRRG